MIFLLGEEPDTSVQQDLKGVKDPQVRQEQVSKVQQVLPALRVQLAIQDPKAILVQQEPKVTQEPRVLRDRQERAAKRS
jgi:hypothetical protein